MNTSGPFADTHGLTGYEPNLTNIQNLVAWTENQKKKKKLTGRKLVMDRFHQTFRGEAHKTSQRTRTLTTEPFVNLLAEQHAYWREEGARAAQEYEQAARDEVHVAVAHTGHGHVESGHAGKNGRS